MWFNMVVNLDRQIKMENKFFLSQIVFYDGLEEAILAVAGDIG